MAFIPIMGARSALPWGLTRCSTRITGDGYFFNVYDPLAVNDDEDSDDYNDNGLIVQEGFMRGISKERYDALNLEWTVTNVQVVQPLRYRTSQGDLRQQVPCIECGKGHLTKVHMDDKNLTCSNSECKEQFIDHGKFIEYKNK